MTTSSFHATNFGSFAGGLPTDMDGYCHTTIAGWMAAHVDFGSERLTRSELRDWAREQAAAARKAVAEANAALTEWQSAN